MFAGVDGVITDVDIAQNKMTVNRKRFDEVAVLD
jgi:hypothetical protein